LFIHHKQFYLKVEVFVALSVLERIEVSFELREIGVSYFGGLDQDVGLLFEVFRIFMVLLWQR
jgi:hypothetical protein